MILTNLIFPYDYIILVILIILIIICTIKGFINSVLSLLTWIGSILITIYAYENFANFITKQLLNIKFFQEYEYITNISSIIIAIPSIFLISLFVLKKIRKFLSEDLDKKILGLLFDKIFGFIYGVFFSYVILTALNIMIKKFEFNELNNWSKENSFLILNVDRFNSKYINFINNKNLTDDQI